MTKTKMSTVAIVTLSVLLAAALAATIVLAAFSFTGSASTTLTFGNGISLEVTGVSGNAWNAHTIDATGTISSETTSTKTGLSQGVSLANITVKNTSSVGVAIAVGYKIEAAGSELASLYVDSSTTATTDAPHTAGSAFATNFTADAVTAGSEAATWKVFKQGANVAAASTVLNYIHSAFNSTELVSGSGFKGTIYIVAVVDDANALTNINAAIATGNYSSFAGA